MSLLRFLRPEKECPNASTSRRPPVIVNEVFSEVNSAIHGKGKKRGEYQKLSPEDKVAIAKYASENGVASAVRKFKEKKLKESSVRDWRNLYCKDLEEKRKKAKIGEAVCVDALPVKKRGKPPLLGEKLDKQLQQMIGDMRSRGTPIGTSVIIGVGRGILLKHKKSTVVLNKEWAKSVLRRMGYTKRKANSKCKVLPDNFEEIKKNYLADIRAVVEVEDVPPSLIINWDHTATKIVPSSQWTMERKGMKRVEIAAVDDKRQITAIFACTLAGKFLPMQLIYQGTTTKCHPKGVEFPADWLISHSANHWANETTTIAYIHDIIIPYVKKEREACGLSSDHCALVLFDVFKGQCTAQVLKLLDDNHILYVTVPSNCTDRLQPLDVSINKPAKDFLRSKFQEWYGLEICRQLESGVTEEVDLRMSTMKPVTAQWMIELHSYIAARPTIIINGFRHTGIKDCIDQL